MSITTTGTLSTTNISPSKPLVNRGLRAIAATYTEETSGTFTLDMTKNFLYGMICEDVDVGATSYEKIEIPLRALQGTTKRFIEGEQTGGNITLNFTPDPETYIPYDIPEPPTSGGLVLEPHFCLWLGFLDSNDPSKLIPYVEAPVNFDSKDNLNWAKNAAATCALNFYITGEGLRIGRDKIGKTLDYTEPSTGSGGSGGTGS